MERKMENQKLEQYLNRLEYCLGGVPVSDKAEIITEIKSHVMDAVESYPDKSISDILNGLGEPEQVANRYLLERGLEPRRAPKHPVVKWLVIGFLGTFAMSLVAFFIVVWQFSPLVNVNEKTGRVQILGGLIDVQEKNGKSKVKIRLDDALIGDKDISNMINGKFEIDIDENEVSGDKDLVKIDAKIPLKLKFSNTSVTIETSDNSILSYECDVVGSYSQSANEPLTYDFTQTTGAECIFKVPMNRDITVDLGNGKLELNKLKNNIKVTCTNAKVEIAPDEKTLYDYDLSVKAGLVDEFIDNDNAANAYKVTVKVVNGLIEKL
jgi:hypothetical protein